MAVQLRWSDDTDGADGLLLTDDQVFVVSSEVVAAWDARTGHEQWNVESADTSGWVPTILHEGLLVVGLEWDPWLAFDIHSGDRRVCPQGLEMGPTNELFDLPVGYRR